MLPESTMADAHAQPFGGEGRPSPGTERAGFGAMGGIRMEAGPVECGGHGVAQRGSHHGQCSHEIRGMHRVTHGSARTCIFFISIFDIGRMTVGADGR